MPKGNHQFHCVQSVEYMKPRAAMGNMGKRATVD